MVDWIASTENARAIRPLNFYFRFGERRHGGEVWSKIGMDEMDFVYV